MPHPLPIQFQATDLSGLAGVTGRIALCVPADAKTPPAGAARALDKAMRGALARYLGSEAWGKVKAGEAAEMAWPAGLAAEAVQVVKLDIRADAATARKAGAAIGKGAGKGGVLVLAERTRAAADLSFGLAMRAYEFTAHKTGERDTPGPVVLMVAAPEAVAAEAAPLAALVEGVFFTRDLVNEPANVLTTDDFAARLAAMQELGLDVEILEEADLEKLGMRTLLAVGQGSESPSKVVVMHWRGGADEAPFALVGKGVVFDTGGISIKPAAGMEEMTMDMGGAGSSRA